MSKKLLFSIITKNQNIDIQFNLNKGTQNINKTSVLLEKILNLIDQETKKKDGISEGDIFQAIALSNAIRIGISEFENEKILEFSNDITIKGIESFKKAKKYPLGNA